MKFPKKNSNRFNCRISFFVLFFALYAHAQDSPLKLKVVSDLANIRDNPDVGGTLLYQATTGTILEAFEKQNEWYRVRLTLSPEKQIVGYVHQSLVIEISKPLEEKDAEVEDEKEEIKAEQTLPPPLPPVLERPEMASFDFSLALGGQYSLIGDLNRGAKGLSDYYKDFLESDSHGNIKPVHLNFIFGGEINFPLHPQFSLGLGADFFFGTRESSVEFTESNPSSSFTSKPEIKAYPIRLVLTYFMTPEIYFKNGIEYYFAQCKYFYRFQSSEGWQEWRGKSTAQSFGILGCVGFIKKITSHLSLFVEATGRYVKIKNLKGENTFTDSTGQEALEEGTLYVFQGFISEENTHTLLFIRERKPSETGVSDPKKAVLDLSGLSLQAGLKVHF